MRPPFPGMDPWLEHTDIWPDVHNSLIAAIRDAMAPQVAPKYYIGLQERTFQIDDGTLALWGIPDLAVSQTEARPTNGGGPRRQPAAGGSVGLKRVKLQTRAILRETFLEVRRVGKGKLVTIVEVLSPANKLPGPGRKQYLKKRRRVFESGTNLVEIDLLRGGKPMPLESGGAPGDYRVLVSREPERPSASLHYFGLRDSIPPIPLPLLPGEAEPPIDLGPILHAMYDRARFDLRLRYDRPPLPPLTDEDAAWARGLAL